MNGIYIVQVDRPNGAKQYVKAVQRDGKITLTDNRNFAKHIESEEEAQGIIDDVVMQYMEPNGAVPMCTYFECSSTVQTQGGSYMDKAKELLQSLDPTVVDYIYRFKRAEYVAQDALEVLYSERNYDEKTTQSIADMVGELWSFEGKYDCNLSYWANINSLIEYVESTM